MFVHIYYLKTQFRNYVICRKQRFSGITFPTCDDARSLKLTKSRARAVRAELVHSHPGTSADRSIPCVWRPSKNRGYGASPGFRRCNRISREPSRDSARPGERQRLPGPDNRLDRAAPVCKRNATAADSF